MICAGQHTIDTLAYHEPVLTGDEYVKKQKSTAQQCL